MISKVIAHQGSPGMTNVPNLCRLKTRLLSIASVSYSIFSDSDAAGPFLSARPP